jgi:hypothetical protein
LIRKIFEPKRKQERGGWRKLYSEELHDLHSSPNIIRVTELRSVRRTAHVARMVTRQMSAEFRWGNLKQRNHLEDISAERRTTLAEEILASQERLKSMELGSWLVGWLVG